MAGTWPQDPYRPILGSLDRKDLEAKGQLCHVANHFEALFIGVLKAASDFS